MKLTTTGNIFSKRVFAFAMLAVVMAAMATRPVQAQVGDGEANGVIGSWRVTANVTSEQGIAPFPVLMTFHADGTMVQSRLYFLPAFGVISTTFHGVWRRADGNQLATTSFSLAQGAPGNAALNGAFFGTEQVSFRPVLGSDGNSFTAHWVSTVFDPSGNPILHFSGDLAGVRVQIEP